eukprot:CAMPEP_0184551350 /NCGR_PEP_ID=MMETSP0199_2-20130426/24723_1 /TAXON_ID=1112570 /ORGANISM="Thraustochytrium sp., Strain LLF1b" /LENGTH=340 /DNA_ID=CAMNT_0026946499 /DNA_START=118 /DNA_END=1136 /DNA_ORIENTATION=+
MSTASNLDAEAEIAAIEDRRKSLIAAQQSLLEARAEAAKYANVYVKPGAEKIGAQAQQVQVTSATQWYNFWEKPSKVPKSLSVKGSIQSWDAIAKTALEEVKALADHGAFGSPSKSGGASVELSSDHIAKGIALTRVKKDIPVAPRAVLLAQIRAQLMGATSPEVLYMREHYNFRGGKTNLFHVVKNYGPGMIAPRDMVLLHTWEEAEDGTITIAAKSVDGTIGEKVVTGTVRASVLLFGMQIKPKEVDTSSFFSKSTTDGSEVSVLNHMLLNGFVPSAVSKQLVLGEVTGFLKSVETTAKALAQDDEIEELITKYVIYPGGPDIDEKEEEEAEEAEEPT